MNDQLAAAVRTVFFLRGQDDQTREDFARLARVRSFPKGNVIFHRGDPCHTAYLMIEGTLKLTLYSEEGRELILNTCDPGEIAGIIPVLDGKPFFASGVTMTPATIARIPADQLRPWLEQRPAVQRALVTELASGLRQAYIHLARQALLPVKERVRAALLEIATSHAHPDSDSELIASRPTHQEIADRIGSTRVVVSRALKELLEEDPDILLSGRELRVRLSAVEVRDL